MVAEVALCSSHMSQQCTWGHHAHGLLESSHDKFCLPDLCAPTLSPTIVFHSHSLSHSQHHSLHLHFPPHLASTSSWLCVFHHFFFKIAHFIVGDVASMVQACQHGWIKSQSLLLETQLINLLVSIPNILKFGHNRVNTGPCLWWSGPCVPACLRWGPHCAQRMECPVNGGVGLENTCCEWRQKVADWRGWMMGTVIQRKLSPQVACNTLSHEPPKKWLGFQLWQMMPVIFLLSHQLHLHCTFDKCHAIAFTLSDSVMQCINMASNHWCPHQKFVSKGEVFLMKMTLCADPVSVFFNVESFMVKLGSST